MSRTELTYQTIIKMSDQQQVECAICMDDIDFNQNNFIKTECNHCFHTSCLMRNIAHNGFACPYCRTEMAEAVEESDDGSTIPEEEEELYDDYALRGLRFFTDNLDGVEHDHEDELEEQEDEENAVVEVIEKPDAAFVAQNLAAQGITMEQLVKILLRDHEEYDAEELEFEQVDEDIWGRIRTIVSNYQPPIPQPPGQQLPVPTPISAPQLEIDNEAQPKLHPNITVRRQMMTHI